MVIKTDVRYFIEYCSRKLFDAQYLIHKMHFNILIKTINPNGLMKLNPKHITLLDSKAVLN